MIGLSFFVKMIALFDCLFVYFCLSLFNLNSFTLYYFHFMLPLHIQIISLKDCLILSNISIWKFLRIIEKYEKHSLTASKYSRHFRHSLVFTKQNSAYLYLTLQCIRHVFIFKIINISIHRSWSRPIFRRFKATLREGSRYPP